MKLDNLYPCTLPPYICICQYFIPVFPFLYASIVLITVSKVSSLVLLYSVFADTLGS